MNAQDGWVFETYIEDLEDDEIFFRTKDEIQAVVDKVYQRFSSGSYIDLADGLVGYLDGEQHDTANLIPYNLGWGTIARVGDGRYVFMSNSWSDSGLFFSMV